MSKKKKDPIKELAEEMDALDEMLGSLVEMLEEKGILTREEWEKRIKKRLQEATELKSYRDIQFQE